MPLRTNPIVHLSAAIARVAAWKPPLRFNDTTRAYFKRLAGLSAPEAAKRYLDVIGSDPKLAEAADEYFLEYEPRHASMVRSSISPNVFQGGYRINVIPSEARATLDVRTHPDDDPERLLAEVRKIVNDPAIEVTWGQRDVRPATAGAELDSEAFTAIEAGITKHYGAVTLPALRPTACGTITTPSSSPYSQRRTLTKSGCGSIATTRAPRLRQQRTRLPAWAPTSKQSAPACTNCE